MKTLKINGAKLKVRPVSTPEEMSKGLMGVSYMPQDEGMLFCYPKEQILSFWMKSTPIPLTIAFIDKNKRIIQIEDLQPNDETSVKSTAPAKWALEVNRGWFKKNNIKVGDTIIYGRLVNIKINKQ